MTAIIDPALDRTTKIVIVVVVAGVAGFAIGWWIRSALKAVAQSQLGTPGVGALGTHVVNVYNTLPAPILQPPTWRPAGDSAPLTGGPRALPASDLSSSVNHDTKFSTLPVGTTPVMVFSAPADRYYKLNIRVISPPGSFVMVAPDTAVLAYSASTAGGGVLVIPVGGWNEIRLKPRQCLYARGNVANVVVSMTASPEVST